MAPGLRKWLMSVLPPEDRNSEEPYSLGADPVRVRTANSGTYPFQYVKEVTIRGCKYVFRPIRQDDDDMMLELFTTFSEDTIYHRFFTLMNMSREKVQKFTHLNYRTEMAIVAEEVLEDGRKVLIGVSRYAVTRSDKNWGEMAVVVGDPWHRKGVGTALLQYLMEVARNEGLEGLVGYVHYDNRAVHKIFEKLDLKVEQKDNGTETQYEVYLQSGHGPVVLVES